MEFLSRQFNPSNNTFPVNLVLHSAKSREAGYDASKTGNFVTANLPFDPTAAFHEYRIDFVPGRVFFHADNVLLAEMGGEAVPTSPGHLLLTHWSNGNPLWSGGPPTETAAFEVSYVKAYFNSSDSARQSDWHGRCVDPRANGAVCDIPDVVVAAADDGTFFFSKQGNMTNNQTVFGSNASGRTRGADAELVWRPVFLGSVVLTGLWAAGLL